MCAEARGRDFARGVALEAERGGDLLPQQRIAKGGGQTAYERMLSGKARFRVRTILASKSLSK